MMKLLLIITLFTFLVHPCEFSFVKCCQRDEYLNYRLKCVRNTKYNESLTNNTHEFDDIKMFNNFSYFGKIPCGGRLFQIKLVENTEVFEDGRIKIFDIRTNKSVVYSVGSFCVELWYISREEQEHIVYLCPCLEYPCVWKCCEPGSQIRSELDWRGRETGSSCSPQEVGEPDWTPQYSSPAGGVPRYRALLHGVVQCGDRHRLHLRGDLGLRDDGAVESESDGLIEPGDHCGDYWRRGEVGRVRTVVACVRRDRLQRWLYAAGAMAGAAVLAVALLVLALCPEARVPGESFAAHIACLAVANFATGLNHLNLHPDRNITCFCLGYVMQMSYLSAFLWLTVLCVDMGRSFSGVRGAPGARRKRRGRWEGPAAWGATGTLGVAALAADLSPMLPQNSAFRPNVGYSKCWFESWQSLWTFFYGPMAILLSTNLLLFAFTSWRVVVLGRGRAMLHREGEEMATRMYPRMHSWRHIAASWRLRFEAKWRLVWSYLAADRKAGGIPEQVRYIIFVKMFTLMGVLWLAELVSACVGGPADFWYLTDMLNLLRAIFLLLIVLRKPLHSWHRAPTASSTLTTSLRSNRDYPTAPRP